MSDYIIKVENLGKKYRIQHRGEGQRYVALRDVLASKAKAPFRWLSARRAKRNGRNDLSKAQGAKREAQDLLARTSLPLAPAPSPLPLSPLQREEEFWALRGVSFEVKQGEVVGIIGRNGAGKSTLLKILSRITDPTEGRVRIRGRVASLLEVGTGFHPELTGRENIFLNGAVLGMTRAEIRRKFDDIVAFAEVEKFIDTPVKRYSSGMYVRLAFAVAAHLEPEILVVDEVLAVGDAAFQMKCLGKMHEVSKGGRTVLFVSHNMGAIRNLCSEVFWLSEGKIETSGSSAKVVDQYLRTTLEKSGSSIDLADAQRPAGVGARLKIRSVEFNGGTPILHGEPLNIRIEFETAAAVYDVGFGFGFSSAEGIRVMSVDSDLLEAQRDLPKGHVGVVEAAIPQLQLQPDRYLLDVGARSGNNSALDYLPGCAKIEVLPGPNTPSLIIRETGGMRIPAQWQWREAGQTTELTSDSLECKVGSHADN